MEENTSKLLCKLEGYKTRMKELHWDATTMSSHELCDKITDTISEFEDALAEEMQTISGETIKPGDISIELPKAMTLKEFIAEFLKDIYVYYSTLSDAKYIGVKSEVESLIHDMNVYDYLADKTDCENTPKSDNVGREVIVKESTLRRVLSDKYTDMLNEWNDRGERISGNYDLPNGSVFIDEDNDFISIKNRSGVEIYHAQGESVWTLIDTVLRPQFTDKEEFERFLIMWLNKIYKENGGEQ